MGKTKKSKHSVRERIQPTGLPSVQEAEGEEGLKRKTFPLLGKLLSKEDGEREWACRSVAHLVCEPDTQPTLLNHQGLTRSLIPLLLDREWGVREAAAGALRNLSAVGGDNTCETLIKDGIVSTLTTMLEECVTHLQTYKHSENLVSPTVVPPTPSPSSSLSPSVSPSPTLSNERMFEGGKINGGDVTHQALATAEQGTHLLLNISESSSVAVDVTSQEQMVPVILHFLQPCLFSPPILTTAAMCLYTLTEDNPPSCRLLTSSPSHMEQLEALLSPVPAHKKGHSHMLAVAAAIAGVIQHLLPSLSPVPHLVSSVFRALGAVLDTDIRHLLHTLTSKLPPSPPQVEGAGASVGVHYLSSKVTSEDEDCVVGEIEDVLSAQELALEVIANFCYTDSEEGGWEVEEEEEVIGGDVEGKEIPMEQDSLPQVECPAWLATVLAQEKMVDRVWKKCCQPVTLSLPHSLSLKLSALQTRWCTVQSRGFAALQNILTILPSNTPCNDRDRVAMWQRVVELVMSGGVAMCEDVTGLLVVLARLMTDEELQCVSTSHLQVLSSVCQKQCQTTQCQLSADILLIMAIVGRRSLKFPLPLRTSLLQVVGEALRDCISLKPCEWLVARALDALYDVFGADECPVQLFSSLQIMPLLENTAAQFSNKVRVKREELGIHYAEVASAQDNLLPFIQYMKTRTTA